MMMYNVAMPKMINYQRLDRRHNFLAGFGEINIRALGTGVLESEEIHINNYQGDCCEF